MCYSFDLAKVSIFVPQKLRGSTFGIYQRKNELFELDWVNISWHKIRSIIRYQKVQRLIISMDVS